MGPRDIYVILFKDLILPSRTNRSNDASFVATSPSTLEFEILHFSCEVIQLFVSAPVSASDNLERGLCFLRQWTVVAIRR